MKKTTFTPEQIQNMIQLLYMLSELIDFTEKHGYPIAEMLKKEKEYFKHVFDKHTAIHHTDTIVEQEINTEDSGNKFFYIDVDDLFFNN